MLSSASARNISVKGIFAMFINASVSAPRVSGRSAMIGIVATLVLVCLPGCERQPQEVPPEEIRAVKTVRVSQVAGGQVRRFAGVVDAVSGSQLSFAVAGKVVVIPVDLGDRVKQGDLLAKLDQEAFVLRLAGSKADLEKAQVELRDSREDLERKRKLAKKGVVPQAVLSKADAQYKSAMQSVESAQARLKLASRDLAHTELTAPFDGVIVKREVDPFREVQPGQVLFELEGENELEVELLIPETLIGWVELRQEVVVEFPAALDLQGQKSIAWVSKIGNRTDQANAYPVTVTLLDPSPRIRPGMTAEVIFTFRAATDDVAYLVPINALLPPDNGLQELSQEHKDASLFVFDEISSTVVKRPVKVSYFTGDQVGIAFGVSEGDIVVVAGVHHLHGGQKVRRIDQP